MNITHVLKNRAEIYGVCAIWIVIFHLYRRILMPYIPVITNIVALGNMAVDIFLFFSGLSLYLSAKRNEYSKTGWKIYFKRRFCRILVPYFIVAVPYFLWSIIVESGHRGFISIFARFVWNISSASFWIKGVQTTWYVYTIAVCYLLFPILYDYIEHRDSVFKNAIILGIFGLFAIVAAHLPILHNSTIAWSRFPIFIIGILAGKYSSNLELSGLGNRTKKLVVGTSAVFFLVSALLLSVHEILDLDIIRPVYIWLFYSPMTLSLVICLLAICNGTNLQSAILKIVGSVSLEIYLIHITLLHPLDFYGVLKYAGNWSYLLLPVVSIIIALGVKKVEDPVVEKFLN